MHRSQPPEGGGSLAPLVPYDTDTGGEIATILQAARTHLGMDIAFVSEFRDERRVFRNVDSAMTACPIRVGSDDPLEDSYCARVVDGRLPELMQDARTVPAAAALPVTDQLPVGAHLSVPLRLSDGRIYGTFCCFSSTPDPSLNERDLTVMRVFAELATRRIEADLEAEARTALVSGWLRAVERGQGVMIAFQPIVALARGRAAGYEALARFTTEPVRPLAAWFAEADGAGLGANLDLALVRKSLSHLPDLPKDAYLSVNVAPSTVTSGLLAPLLESVPSARIVLEITEHAIVESYEELTVALGELRRRGVRVAVDDAGAGYASLRHILQLQPEVIKLDVSLTRGIDRDPGLRALASALLAFAKEMGSTIVAEGVETSTQLTTLRSVGVTHAQGYHLGRPAPPPGCTEEAGDGAGG